MKRQLIWVAALLVGAVAALAQDEAPVPFPDEIVLEQTEVDIPSIPPPWMSPDYGSTLIILENEVDAGMAPDGVEEEEAAEVIPVEEEAPPLPEVSAEPVEAVADPYGIQEALGVLEGLGVALSEDEVRAAVWHGLFREVPGFRLSTPEEVEQAQQALEETPEGDPLVWELLPNKLGLLKIQRVDENTSAALNEALAGMSAGGVNGLVLDLRGTKSLGENFQLLPRLLPVNLRVRGGAQDVDIEGRGDLQRLKPVVVLVNAETELDGEILAAAWILNSAVVGTPTRGNPRVMGIFGNIGEREIVVPLRPLRIYEGTALKAEYNGMHGVTPQITVTEEAAGETVFEPNQPRLRKGQELSDEEKEDRALRDRTRKDAALRYATDILLGLRAVGYAP